VLTAVERRNSGSFSGILAIVPDAGQKWAGEARMRWIVNLAKSTMIAILVAAPIGKHDGVTIVFDQP